MKPSVAAYGDLGKKDGEDEMRCPKRLLPVHCTPVLDIRTVVLAAELYR